MTREQARNLLRNSKPKGNNAHSLMLNEALDIAIEALEQEPCEDCISRQAVLDKLNRLIEVERLQGTDEMGYGRERVSAYECMIHAVESEYLYPTIQPQPKTGHWTRVTDKTGHLMWECKCGWQQRFHTNYCPDCGIKMVEPYKAESEDKG